MKRLFHSLLIASAALVTLASSELAEYVAREDQSYAWEVVGRETHPEGSIFTLHMVSQRWLTERAVDHPLWEHRMMVYAPAEVRHDTALLLVSGGNRISQLNYKGSRAMLEIALKTRSVTAVLLNVPNQPLVFADDPEKRSRHEDDILAYQWAQYLKSGDAAQLALLPMVKSAVRAMDTVTALCAGEHLGRPAGITRFVVTGQSKRGWTTWLTAAVDRRVVAIAPQVIDMLNMQLSFKHHKRAYGEYSSAVHPYVENGIMEAIDTPAAEASMKILDPFAYRNLLTMPKMIINSGGDQFFLPDSWRFYYNELQGPRYLRYIPNCGHGLDGSERYTLLSFYASILESRALPEYQWQVTTDGQITVSCNSRPIEVRLWQVDNPDKRDFRLDVTGKTWTSSTMQSQASAEGPGLYRTNVEPPAQGWRAFFVELTFPDPAAGKLRLTTGVAVLPDTLPF